MSSFNVSRKEAKTLYNEKMDEMYKEKEKQKKLKKNNKKLKRKNRKLRKEEKKQGSKKRNKRIKVNLRGERGKIQSSSKPIMNNRHK